MDAQIGGRAETLAPYFKGKNVVPVPATIPPQDLYMLTPQHVQLVGRLAFRF